MSTKSPLVSAIVAGSIVAMAFVLNPSPEQHRAKIKEAIAERNQLARMFGLGALGMVFFIQPSQDK